MKIKLFFIFCFCCSLSVSPQNFIKDDEARSEKMAAVFSKSYPHLYTNKDSAYFYIEKALKVTDPSKDDEARLLLLQWLIATSSYHYDLPKYDEFLKRVDLFFQTDSIEFKLSDYQAEKDALSLVKGEYYFKLSAYNRAQPYFKKLSDKYTSINLKDHTKNSVGKYISVNNYLATIYRNKGKYDLAEQYYVKTGELINTYYQGKLDGPFQQAANEQLLAELYNRTGKYQKANTLLRKSLPVYVEGLKKKCES